MKKLLLIAALAATTFSANAQQKASLNCTMPSLENVKFAKDLTRAEPEPMEVYNMYYYRPDGLFYPGWNASLMSAGYAFAPANTPIEYKAYYTDGQPLWTYPTGEFNEQGQELGTHYQGDSFTLNLPAGEYTVPYIQNSEDPENDFFMPCKKLRVGGLTKKGVEEVDGAEYNLDEWAVNYVPTMNLTHLAGILCTKNEEADKAARKYLFKGDATYTTLGFGEEFYFTTKCQVRAFSVLVIGEMDIATKASSPRSLKASIFSVKKGQEQGEMLKTKDDFNVKVTTVDENTKEKIGIYFIEFEVKGDPMQMEAGQTIIPMIETNKLMMTPWVDLQPRWDEVTYAENPHITTMILIQDSTNDGYGPISLPSLGQTNDLGETQYVNSWCIGLDMSYAEDGFAGINTVVADKAAGNGAVYTISGVKVSNGDVENLPAGIYVKNGTKFVVR